MASEELPSNAVFNGDALASIAEMQEFGAKIVEELDKAEADLDNTVNQPFSGMSEHIMSDIAHLRNRQFDMYKRHVEIENSYKIHDTTSANHDEKGAQTSSHSGGRDGSRQDGVPPTTATFSSIATTLRQKESATANLLNRLADFDAQLRNVLNKFEAPNSSAAGSSTVSTEHVDSASQAQPQSSSARPQAGESLSQHYQPPQTGNAESVTDKNS